MTDLHRNKAVMRKIYRDLVSAHDLTLLDQLFAADVIDHEAFGSDTGREGFRAFFQAVYESFPDYQIKIEDLIAEDDRVVARVTSTGTHRGEFMGLAPTGRRFAVSGIDIMRFDDGQVVEHWGVTDLASLHDQIRGPADS